MTAMVVELEDTRDLTKQRRMATIKRYDSNDYAISAIQVLFLLAGRRKKTHSCGNAGRRSKVLA